MGDESHNSPCASEINNLTESQWCKNTRCVPSSAKERVITLIRDSSGGFKEVVSGNISLKNERRHDFVGIPGEGKTTQRVPRE